MWFEIGIIIFWSLIIFLFLYGSVLFLFTLLGSIFLSFSKKQHINDTEDQNSSFPDIDVLIPSYNEGIHLQDALDSLIHQDYPGTIHIFVLMKDEHDSSVPFLQDRYGDITQAISVNNHTTLHILFLRVNPKREKINVILPTLDAPYTAFLDADHVADSDWLSQSIAGLLEVDSSKVAIQGQRRAKPFRSLFGFIDSLQNHIGNEFLNTLLSRISSFVFFTGTTAVFRSEYIHQHSFPDSITEDTALSYEILREGKSIQYLATTGSQESVSPRLQDYVARRRRWSGGHNRIFLSRMSCFWKELFTGHISLTFSFRKTLTLFFHQIFFFTPVLAVLVINILYGFTFLQFTSYLQWMTVSLSLIFSWVLSRWLGKGYQSLIFDILFGFIWVFPIVTSLVLLSLFVARTDLYYYLLSFPYLNTWMLWLVLIAVLVPLATVLLAIIMRRKKWYYYILTFLTYPIILLFDTYAIFMGWCDIWKGPSLWKPIRREAAYVKFWKHIVAVLLILLSIITLSYFHFFSFRSCGDHANPIAILWAQIQGQHTSIVVHHHKEISDDGNFVHVEIYGHLGSFIPEQEIVLTIEPSGETHFTTVNHKGRFAVTTLLPFGFEQYTASLRVEDRLCVEHHSFTNTHIGIDGNDIMVNGEPFIVKGIVPNFLQRNLDLSREEGIQQIKELGVNVLRYYHPPQQELLDAIQDQQLFVIPQVGRSNWENTDLQTNRYRGLLGRYRGLQEEFGDQPFVLALNAGNELEIQNHRKITAIENLLTDINAFNSSVPSIYSTFLTFINYPSDILGINMLDTGYVYWSVTIPELLTAIDRPIIATELGGFEAFYEATDERVRIIRLKQYWNILLSHGAAGGMMFQSHDNWGQPVPHGYNNPFVPEQPDDLRGIWDHNNEAKPIVEMVRSIFSDVQLDLNPEDFQDEMIPVTITNIRPYALRSIRLEHNREDIEVIQSLDPQESFTYLLPVEWFGGDIVSMNYSTHHGLDNVHILNLPQLTKDTRPFFIDRSEIIIDTDQSDRVVFTPLDNEVQLWIPDGWVLGAQNDVGIQRGDSSYDTLINASPFSEPNILSIRSDNNELVSLPRGNDQGIYTFVLDISSKDLFEETKLVVNSLGGSDIWITAGDVTITSSVHAYRETYLPIFDWFHEHEFSTIELTVNRNQTIYTQETFYKDTPTYIDMQAPLLFTPKQFVIERR